MARRTLASHGAFFVPHLRRGLRLLDCGCGPGSITVGMAAAREGVIGVCGPDWGGFLLSPPSPALSRAVEAYMGLQSGNGGNVQVGRNLGVYLAAAGFEAVQLSARYECYEARELIAEYLARRLEKAGDAEAASVLRHWSKEKPGRFAQAWVSAVARKPRERSYDRATPTGGYDGNPRFGA